MNWRSGLHLSTNYRLGLVPERVLSHGSTRVKDHLRPVILGRSPPTAGRCSLWGCISYEVFCGMVVASELGSLSPGAAICLPTGILVVLWRPFLKLRSKPGSHLLIVCC